MSADAETMENGHVAGSTGLFVGVWVTLLVLTMVEVFLAYKQVELHTMLILLVIISIVKSAMIIAYFMHLKFEKPGLAWLLMPALIFCISMMLLMSMWDGARLLRMRP